MQLAHILLVEDNEDHYELIRETFVQNNIVNDLCRVETGEEALAYLRGQSTDGDARRPDLVLLDLNLPGVAGMEVLREVKTAEELSSIPVFVLTTSAADRDKTFAEGFRADGYFVKPLTIENLQEVASKTGLHWGMMAD